MNKRFSDRALIISSLILGGCIIIAALIISPVNPFAPVLAPAFKVAVAKDSIKHQFIAQMTKKLQRDPKADVAPGSQLQSITVHNVNSGTHMGGIRGIKIEYTLTYRPSGTYPYSCWISRMPQGNYIGNAPYGLAWGATSGRVQSAYIKME